MAREVELTNSELMALVDDEDYELVSGFNWYLSTNGYAQTQSGGQTLLMHRLVLELKPGDGRLVDHRNRDKLDNRKSNLREATNSLNSANEGLRKSNTSGYKGVTWDSAKGKWLAQIMVNGRRKFLGYHPMPELAARAYDEAALEAWGEFAKLNFPDELAA